MFSHDIAENAGGCTVVEQPFDLLLQILTQEKSRFLVQQQALSAMSKYIHTVSILTEGDNKYDGVRFRRIKKAFEIKIAKLGRHRRL